MTVYERYLWVGPRQKEGVAKNFGTHVATVGGFGTRMSVVLSLDRPLAILTPACELQIASCIQ